MNTNDIPATWKLGNTNRVVRAIIGVGTILSALMIPGLSEGWLFALAMIGFYASQTAILNTDLVYAFFAPSDRKEQTHESTSQKDEQYAEEVQFEFKQAA